MRLLLDTHAVLWSLLDDPHLSRTARSALSDGDNLIVVSAVSIFEISLKYHIGKLPSGAPFVRHHVAMMTDLDWSPLPITITHAARAGGLPIPHKDPFDRLLIAQAEIEGLTLVSNERLFDEFGVRRLW